MKILFVHFNLCIRTVKFICALKAKGHDIYVAYGATNQTNRRWMSFLEELLTPQHIFYFSDGNSLQELLRRLKSQKFDIIQSANEPNWPAGFCIREKIAPVIFDCHDMTTMRNPEEKADWEREVFERSDGIIFVGERVEKYARRKYEIKSPTTIIYSRVPEDLFQKRKKKIEDGTIHIVLEGGVITQPSGRFQYKYYTPIFKQICDQGIHIHVYPTAKVKIEELQNHPFFHLYDPLSYKELLEEISQYHYGIVGFNFDLPEEKKSFLNATTPNKIFDYLSAGIPTIVYNMKTSSEIVEKHKIGFTCKDIKNLSNDIKEKGAIQITEDKIKSLTMDAIVVGIENFYKLVIEEKK